MSEPAILHTVEIDSAELTRRERDRFVAFAFCAADILLELDDQYDISFATGAVHALLGCDGDSLIGSSLVDLVTPEYASMIRTVLDAARRESRMHPVPMRLRGPNGQTPRLNAMGYHLADLPKLGGRYYISLRLDTAHFGDTVSRDTTSGLLQPDSFAAAAAKRLRTGPDDVKISFVQMNRLDSLRAKLDDETRETLNETIGAYLRASSVDGDSAGALDSERFGVLHHEATDLDDVEQRLADYARVIDPDGEGVSIDTATMSAEEIGVGRPNISGTELTRALIHAMDVFCTQQGDNVAVADLSRELSGITRRTVDRIARFRDVIANGSFSPVFQPIVNLHDNRPHHFEALTRFDDTGTIESPYEDIRFAENVGLIGEFDLAMCNKVLDWLRALSRQGHRYEVAVNLSGNSPASDRFIQRFFTLLSDYDDVRGQVIFELTESAEIRDIDRVRRFLNRLRSAGHRICLDDFGAGAASMRYLRAFDVDVIKIDGAFVADAVSSMRTRLFLKAIVSMCRELGAVTVAEMITDKPTLQMVKEAGIQLGQGYLLGRPNADVSRFDAPKAQLFTGAPKV